MWARWLWLLSLAWLCACRAPETTADVRTPTPVPIRTDAALLAERINVPSGIQSVRWSVVPLGNAGGPAPGPTDTRLYAFLQPQIAAAADLRLLADGQEQVFATVPATLARELLPAQTVAALQPDPAGDLLLPGERYDPTAFDRGAFHGVYAVKVGEGLLVCLQTR